MPSEEALASVDIEDVGLKIGKWKWSAGSEKNSGSAPFPTYEAGLKFVMDQLLKNSSSPIKSVNEIVAVAHRVVHGGPKYVDSLLITPAVVKGIADNVKLAPLHTPPNLKGIRTAQKLLPNVPHTAVFDTGFHKTMPDHVAAYGLPDRFFKQHGIKRYGFHGISYRFVIGEAAKIIGKPLSKLKLVAAHLGSGCSICAIDRGKSLDTSMGFTPVEGLLMRTRTGDIDAGVILHLQNEFGMTANQLNKLLNHQSGFFGVSGGAATMPQLIKRKDEGDIKSKLAYEMFCYRVRKYIGAYAAAMGGCDGIIFTAGIGENQPDVRANIIKPLEFMRFKIDSTKNRNARGKLGAVHAKDSLPILAIPTNEGLMMARDTYDLVKGRR